MFARKTRIGSRGRLVIASALAASALCAPPFAAAEPAPAEASDTDHREDVAPEDDPRTATTIGGRRAVALDDVMILGGPHTTPDGRGALSLWAYEGSTGTLLGSTQLTEYADMRCGLVIKENLYVAVRKAGFGSGGAILKWTGDKADPFRFEVVADFASEPAYVTEHEGRIVTAGWPDWSIGKTEGPVASMYLSPPIPDGGLSARDAGEWQKIWSLDAYEPDPVVARAAAFGDLVSWRGKLYFSTMHLPGAQTLNAFSNYGWPRSWLGRLDTFVHAERATAVFSMENAGRSGQKVTLLVGEETLPVYDVERRAWTRKPNRLGQKPKLGPSGFGSPFNAYSWRWVIFGDRLYTAR